MDLEKDTVKKYQPLTSMGLSDDEKNDIWAIVEENIYGQHRQHRTRASRRLGPIFVATAAIVIVGIGGYTVMRHHAQPTVTAHKQQTSPKPSMPSSLQTVYMTTNNGSQSKWHTNDVNAVSKHVTGWLKQSHLYVVKSVDKSSISQVQMHFTTSEGQTGIVSPVSSLKNVVVYQVQSHEYYLKSPALFEWLQSGKWQTVFVNPYPVDLPYISLGDLQLNVSLSSLTGKYGQPTTKTIVHGNGAPEWIYKKQGVIVDGDPIWQIRATAPFQGALTNGIRIGSSKVVVEKAYPNLKTSTLPDGTWYAPSSPDKKYQTLIGIQNGVVTSITILENIGRDTRPQW